MDARPSKRKVLQREQLVKRWPGMHGKKGTNGRIRRWKQLSRGDTEGEKKRGSNFVSLRVKQLVSTEERKEERGKDSLRLLEEPLRRRGEA